MKTRYIILYIVIKDLMGCIRMKGIKLCHGVMFVKCDYTTVRVLANGECGVSPITFENLEWDLRTEPPESWEYVSEDEIRSMGSEIYEKILEVEARVSNILNKRREV